MSLPQVIVEAGLTGPEVPEDLLVLGDPVRGLLGTGKLGSASDEIWTDISQWVRSWSVTRGSRRGDDPTLRYETGTATIELNDGDRRFDPDNLDGPYVLGGVTLLTPRRRVRIRAVWDGVTYPILTGLADDWLADYQGSDWTYTTLAASDAGSYFEGYDRSGGSTVGAGEDSGARAARILDGIGWPTADRLISTGDTTLQATTLSGNVRTELLLVQDTELGELYVDARGRVVFRNRRAMLTDDRSTTSQVTFGDAGYPRPITYGFESGVADFGATGGTVSASTLAYEGSQSLLMTVVGTPPLAYPRQVYPSPITEGHRYTATFWVYYPVGGSVGAAIDWFDGGGGYLGTAGASTVVPAATWTQLTVTGTAPATSALTRFGPTLTSPGAGVLLYLDAMRLVDLDAEIPYAAAVPSSMVESLVNTVIASNGGGTEQVAQDSTSVAAYLVKTHTRNDLLAQTDAEALLWANAIKYQYAQPRRRWQSISFNTPAPEVAAAHWPAVLGREFADRITVTRRPAGGGSAIVRDCFVRGITHQSDGVEWKTSLILQAADRYSFFVLTDPILGVLGANALAY